MPWWPLRAQLLHPSSFCRPRTFSTLPFRAQLVPSVGLYRFNLCLTADFPGPACASPQPPRPSSCLSAASTGPTPTSMASLGQAYASQWPFWPSFCLLAASPDPELPQVGLSRPSSSSWRPPQAQTVVKSACPGSAPASKSSSSRPPQAQLWPLSGLSGCKSSSSQPLQAQLLLPPSDLFQPSPAHASRRPSQAPLLTFGGLCRPEFDLQSASPGPASCLPKACTGPASASRRTLHAQLALTSLRPPQSKAPAFPPLRQARLPPASGLFRPMGLIPHNGLSRPSFSLPAASPGPEPPQVGLSRPTCSLPASSPGPGLPPGCVSRPDSGLPTTSLDSAPAQLLVALVGPQLPQAKLPRPSSGLMVASPGSAPAFQRRLQAPNGVRSVGSSRPSLGLPATSAGPSRPEVSLSRPSSGLPASKLFWLSSCPAPASLSQLEPFPDCFISKELVIGLSRPPKQHRNEVKEFSCCSTL
nr:nascent polypeptide-associated complex subunit alpha, muscle-specific form-like [Pongo abelii]